EGVKVPVTPPAIKYYAKTVILNTTDKVTLTAYDITGKVLDTKIVSATK
ncbi:immunoglobulin-like domain-containing protein, partial [Paenilisteria newyorkensis]